MAYDPRAYVGSRSGRGRGCVTQPFRDDPHVIRYPNDLVKN